MKFTPISSFFHVFMVGLGRCCGAIVTGAIVTGPLSLGHCHWGHCHWAIVTGVVGSLVRRHECRFSVDWGVNLLSAS